MNRFKAIYIETKYDLSLLRLGYEPDGKGGWIEHKWDYKFFIKRKTLNKIWKLLTGKTRRA